MTQSAINFRNFDLFIQYRESYVRTSGEDYDLDLEKMDRLSIHLTNNAIQKYNENYGKFEDGNQLSLH